MARKTKRPEPQPTGGRGLKLSRRSLLKAGGAVTLAAGALSGRPARGADPAPGADGLDGLDELGANRETYWSADGSYFVQKNVDVGQVGKGIIRARVNGVWRDFVIREVDNAFFDFNMKMRQRMLGYMMGMSKLEMYNDAHNAAVGTYGSNRGDSSFILNVAFKGMGWVPKPEHLDARIKELEDKYLSDMATKIAVLTNGYKDVALWERRFLGSLELYTSRQYETHTFLNQMVNPVSTLCTLAEQSYEFRTIARLMHPKDPGLSDWEKKVVTYINYAHDFFHGGPDKTKLVVHNIGVMYFIVEEFDDSPWGATPTAGGKKRVPAP